MERIAGHHGRVALIRKRGIEVRHLKLRRMKEGQNLTVSAEELLQSPRPAEGFTGAAAIEDYVHPAVEVHAAIPLSPAVLTAPVGDARYRRTMEIVALAHLQPSMPTILGPAGVGAIGRMTSMSQRERGHKRIPPSWYRSAGITNEQQAERKSAARARSVSGIAAAPTTAPAEVEMVPSQRVPEQPQQQQQQPGQPTAEAESKAVPVRVTAAAATTTATVATGRREGITENMTMTAGTPAGEGPPQPPPAAQRKRRRSLSQLARELWVVPTRSEEGPGAGADGDVVAAAAVSTTVGRAKTTKSGHLGEVIQRSPAENGGGALPLQLPRSNRDELRIGAGASAPTQRIGGQRREATVATIMQPPALVLPVAILRNISVSPSMLAAALRVRAAEEEAEAAMEGGTEAVPAGQPPVMVTRLWRGFKIWGSDFTGKRRVPGQKMAAAPRKWNGDRPRPWSQGAMAPPISAAGNLSAQARDGDNANGNMDEEMAAVPRVQQDAPKSPTASIAPVPGSSSTSPAGAAGTGFTPTAQTSSNVGHAEHVAGEPTQEV